MGRTSYLMLLVTYIVLMLSSLAADAKHTDFKAFITRQRDRRALATMLTDLAKLRGLTAEARLLKGMGRPSVRAGKLDLYFKRGGKQAMIQDFRSVNPSHIRSHENTEMGPGLQGLVGDRIIYYGITGDGTPRLLIIKRPLDKTPLVKSNAVGIIYEE